MSNDLGKTGETIKWDFKEDRYKNYPSFLKGHEFTAQIAMVDTVKKHYGVYASYGQDLIPFDECTLINKEDMLLPKEGEKKPKEWKNKNIIDLLNFRIQVAKDHEAKYEVQKLQQDLDIQLERNKIL